MATFGRKSAMKRAYKKLPDSYSNTRRKNSVGKPKFLKPLTFK